MVSSISEHRDRSRSTSPVQISSSDLPEPRVSRLTDYPSPCGEQAASTSRGGRWALPALSRYRALYQRSGNQRIAAVLDEDLLVSFQRTVNGEIEREFAAVA